MDDYLAALGLHRKRVAKDGSCLFRAVAEQVRHCQSLHAQVRAECVRFLRRNRASYEAFIEGDFESYLRRLEDPQQWAGEVEMNALAIMYKRDFVIFQEPGQPPVDITGNKFKEKVQLSFLNGNHYDSVYPISHIKNAALCQSILYELLYAEVFQVRRHALASWRSGGRACVQLSDIHMAACASSESDSDPDPDAGDSRSNGKSWTRGRGRGLILSESVRRSLNADLYRNVAYDVWRKFKKAQQKQDYSMAAELQFSAGRRRQVRPDGSERDVDAGVRVTLYAEDEGQTLRSVTSEVPGRSDAVRREGRLSDGRKGTAVSCQEVARGRGKSSGPRAGARVHVQRQKSRWKNTSDASTFGLTEEERLAKDEELENVALVELQMKDERSFPALGVRNPRASPLKDIGVPSSRDAERRTSAALRSADSSRSSPPSANSAVPSSNIPAGEAAPVFIAPVAPSPSAATAVFRRLSSPGPSTAPRRSSSSPAPHLPRVADALRSSAAEQSLCPDLPADRGATEEARDGEADAIGDASDPPRNRQVRSEPPPAPLLQNPGQVASVEEASSGAPFPTGRPAAHLLQNPGQIASVEEASSGAPFPPGRPAASFPPGRPAAPLPQNPSQIASVEEASSGAPFPPGRPAAPLLQNPSQIASVEEASSGAPFPPGRPPTLAGNIPVRHLSQDPLYPGFPMGENGNVLPTPDFSLRESGEDLPRDINVLRFFFNLGVKAYTWPFYMPWVYLLPLQQTHIVPQILCPAQTPHHPPDDSLPPADDCYGRAWREYGESAWRRQAAESAARSAPLATSPRNPFADVLRGGSLETSPIGSLETSPIATVLAPNTGEDSVNVMPQPDDNARQGGAVPLARTPPPHHPSVGSNTEEAYESNDQRPAQGRHYGGRRGGYRRRRGREPGVQGRY
nr:OTU domain-containing protein 4-like [Nerophis lumbriciformis]